ncbi:hypothetical protein ACFL27_02765 [candidate division CSSED10-310 bacterium]|uniref:Golvesin/Xly CBD-like domain-containing protein n=1 Tax=candidate division CSSED10-310 bacterium TaxID=2855610 RepID=A0ABV6YSE4_UNCC1
MFKKINYTICYFILMVLVSMPVYSNFQVNTYTTNLKWNFLGEFIFNAGLSGSVKIRNDNTNGYVIADAVKFVPVIQITDNSINDWYPQIHNDKITWQGGDGSVSFPFETFFWNGSYNIQITDDILYDGDQQIHNSQITWVKSDGSDLEIFFCDPSQVFAVPTLNLKFFIILFVLLCFLILIRYKGLLWSHPLASDE